MEKSIGKIFQTDKLRFIFNSSGIELNVNFETKIID